MQPQTRMPCTSRYFSHQKLCSAVRLSAAALGEAARGAADRVLWRRGRAQPDAGRAAAHPPAHCQPRVRAARALAPPGRAGGGAEVGALLSDRTAHGLHRHAPCGVITSASPALDLVGVCARHIHAKHRCLESSTRCVGCTLRRWPSCRRTARGCASTRPRARRSAPAWRSRLARWTRAGAQPRLRLRGCAQSWSACAGCARCAHAVTGVCIIRWYFFRIVLGCNGTTWLGGAGCVCLRCTEMCQKSRWACHDTVACIMGLVLLAGRFSEQVMAWEHAYSCRTHLVSPPSPASAAGLHGALCARGCAYGACGPGGGCGGGRARCGHGNCDH